MMGMMVLFFLEFPFAIVAEPKPHKPQPDSASIHYPSIVDGG